MNEKPPSRKMALKLLSESGCSKRVVEHCKAVSALALKFAKICKNKGLAIDVDLVEVGALLHDIGRSKTHGITHAIVGKEIAKSMKLPDPIVSIIECHIGGGLAADEARKLGLPVKNYLPTTLEEKIVTYADKLIEGQKVIPIEKTIEKLCRELGPNHPAVYRVIRLHEELFPFLRDFYANSYST